MSRWLALALLAPAAYAGPIELTWQARLLDSAGAPLNGTRTVEIALFGSEVGADLRWADDFSVQLADGYATVVLGSADPLDHDLFATGDLWVEVRDGVGGAALGARQRLSHAPRAAVADGIRIEGAAGGSACVGQGGALVYDTTIGGLRLCDGANWINLTTRTVIQGVDGVYQYADNSLAPSCKEYRTPTSGGRIAATESGRYRIDVDGAGPTPAVVVQCDMVTDGGGWTLISNRRANASNIETCGSHINGFLQSGCGSADAIGPTQSYALATVHRNGLGYTSLLLIQYSAAGVVDADDAYILEFGGPVEAFPNNTSANDIAASRVCNLTRTTCDTTNVYWKFVGQGYFGSTWCNSAQSGVTSYGGNYGLCQDGVSSQYMASGFAGNRLGYDETKLWNYSTGSEWHERLWVR